MLWSRATLKLPRPSLTSNAAQAVASPTPPRHSTGTRSSIHKFVNTPRIVKVHRKEAVATLTSLSQAVNTEIRRSWDTAFVDYFIDIESLRRRGCMPPSTAGVSSGTPIGC